LWNVCYKLREQIQVEREDHKEALTAAYDGLSFLLKEWALPGLHAAALSSTSYDAAAVERDVETERLRKVALVYRCVTKWQDVTRWSKDRVNTFIAVRSMVWRERAKRAVMLSQQQAKDDDAVEAMLLEQKVPHQAPLVFVDGLLNLMCCDCRRRALH
jgi:hypothetical protein